MLEELESTDWRSLEHAYGEAADAPELLRSVAAGRDVEQSLIELWSAYVHQGTRFPASPMVVPHLFEILGHGEHPASAEIVDLLLGLAVGLGESFLPAGYDLAREDKRFADDDWSGLYPYPDARASYHAVLQQADRFLDLIHPPRPPDVRLAAGFAAAHFAQALAPRLHEVLQLLESEAHAAQIQSLLLCAGMLGRFGAGDVAEDALAAFLASHEPSVRLSAAIAITTARGDATSAGALGVIYAALKESWPVEPAREERSWWNDGRKTNRRAAGRRRRWTRRPEPA